MRKIYKIIRRKYNRVSSSLKCILKHPLTQGDRLSALKRYFLFHTIGRLLPGPVMYPFIKNIRFVVQPGMAGIVGNIYTGIEDFEEMGFLLHLLREGDLFVDVGANVGAYTLLAAGVCKAEAIAIEPIPATVNLLLLNLRVNDLLQSVTVGNYGVGSSCSELYFTQKHDVMNHAWLIKPDNCEDLMLVKVLPLDEILEKREPILVKIDVEGFEYEVIRGMTETLESATLKAIIIETRGYEKRYGFTYADIHNILVEKGFGPFVYDPFSRSLSKLDSYHTERFNNIYIKDETFVIERLKSASSVKVLNKII
jgi:FkbM family methyltransferase